VSSDNVTKTYSMPKKLADAVRDSAEEEGISESAIVRWAIEAFFEKAEAANKKARKKS